MKSLVRRCGLGVAAFLCSFCFCMVSREVTAQAAEPEFDVTGVIVNEIVDGSAPFDSDNNPGNDSGSNNRVIRTFDNVRYTMEVAMNMKRGSSVRSLSSADLGVELSIPCQEGEFGFAIADMGWLAPGYTVTYENGAVVLRGKTTLKQVDGADPVPGTAAFTVSINARAARNGQMLEPKFRVYPFGGEFSTDASYGETFVCDRNHRTADGQLCGIRVSCTSKGVDVHIVGSTMSYGYMNPSTGELDVEPVEGGHLAAMQAVGLGLMLRSDSAERGIKGLECPKGDISFDVKVTHTRTRGIPEAVGVWDLSSMKANYFKNYLGDLNGHTMDWFTNCTGAVIPGSAGNGGSNQCANGGDWSVTDLGDGNYRFTVKNYEITDYFPRQHLHTGGGSVADKRNWDFDLDKNYFSCGMVNWYTPVSDGVESGTYNFSYQVSNFSAKSASGATMRDMYSADDVSSGRVIMSSAGMRRVEHTYNLGSGGDSTDHVGAGRSARSSMNAAVRERGDTFSVQQYLNSTNGQALKGYMYGCEYLFKFDERIYEAVPESKNIGYLRFGSGRENSWWGFHDTSKASYRNLYAALKDQNGFQGDEDLMRTAQISDCVFYETLEDLQADGKVCIGYLIEARGLKVAARLYWGNSHSRCFLKVRDDAPIDAIGYIFGGLEGWFGDDSPGKDLTLEYSLGPGGKALPERECVYYTATAQTAEWSSAEDGREWTKNGGPYGANGSAALVIGEIAKAGIALENGQSVYNLNYGEREADILLTPALESKTSSCGKSTLHVKVSLPKHLYYKQGSALAGGTYVPATGSVGSVVLDGESFEPQVVRREDGGQDLVWMYSNILPNEELPKIHFKVDIGTLSDPKSDVLETNNPLTVSVRTWSTYGAAYGKRAVSIRVIKALATSLYFKAVDATIEKNGDAKWNMIMSNYSNIDSKPWNMYVATPYTDDGRDSGVSGSLPLRTIVLDAARCARSLGSGFQVYVTSDPAVKNYSGDRFDASVMNGLKSGWSEVTPSKNGNTWTYTIGSDVTCIKFSGGMIGANEAFSFTLHYDPTNCVGGDVFMNSVSVFSERFPSTIFSAPSDVNVVNRILSGFVYNDRNKNGYKDLDEKTGDVLMSGVVLRLLKSDGSRMTDINGREIADVKVGKDGTWRFDDFGPGAVKVAVLRDQLDSKYELSPYLNYNGDDGSKKDFLAIDNDFVGKNMECGSVRVFGDDGYSMKELSFRTADEMNPPVQEISNIGLGLAVYWSDLTVEKVIDESHFVSPFGSHVYWFKAEGTAWDGSHRVYYVPVTIGADGESGTMPHSLMGLTLDEDGQAIEDVPTFATTKQGKAKIRVPSGNYTVTELDVRGWDFLDFLAVNGVVNGERADMDLLIHETGLVNARDYRTSFDLYRDAKLFGKKLK